MSMAPLAETNVIGRHGRVGIEVLSHDLPLEVGLPVEIDARYADLVDKMDERVIEMLRAERAENVGKRSAEMALAETVTIEQPRSTETVHANGSYYL